MAATSEIALQSADQYARTAARSYLGWDAGDVVDRLIAATLSARTPSDRPPGAAADGIVAQIQAIDVTDLAAAVQAPTLVLHARENTFVSQDAAEGLAAAIPGARLVVLDGESLFLPVGVADQALAAIDAFIRETSAPGEPTAVSSRAAAGVAPGPPYPDRLTLAR